MVTAVSPSSFDYEETISTLKYADRAKRYEKHLTNKLLAMLPIGCSLIHFLLFVI